MSSLAIISPANPQSQIESLQRELYQRNREIAELREELRQERGKANQVESGAAALRVFLRPLHSALLQVFGEMDNMGVSASSSSVPDSRVAAIWADWKQKFPGHPSKAIDALLLHGSMTQGQLRIAVGCATGTISNVVSILNKAGLINKNGGKISLKEL